MLFGFRRFYSEIIVTGTENLPEDNSALIFAPNHLNALMDALAVSYILPRDRMVVYVAKADLFSSKISTFIMRLAKILPAYRKIDGIENLDKNNDTFDVCIDVLKDGGAIGIMPEGGQGEKHQIRPLVKGIFRIAFEAQKQIGKSRNVKIIPLGIDMGDLIKSGNHLIINIGKPINIQDYITSYETNPSVTINQTKQLLRKSLSDLTLDIASNDYYDTIQFLADIEGYKFIPEKNDKQPTYSRFLRKQQFIKELLQTAKNEPEKMERIQQEADKQRELLGRHRLTPAVFAAKKEPVWKLFVGLPVFIFGFLTNALPTFVPVWIRKIIGIEYDGFYSSVQFGIGLITFPLFYVLQTALFYNLLVKSHLWSFVFLILGYISRQYAIKWWKEAKKYIKISIFGKSIQ